MIYYGTSPVPRCLSGECDSSRGRRNFSSMMKYLFPTTDNRQLKIDYKLLNLKLLIAALQTLVILRMLTCIQSAIVMVAITTVTTKGLE